jgi:nucleotide-binding universal stress UspA family protein
MSRIIVPVDGSAEMNKIVEKALSLAKEMGRDVIALYVIDTPRLTKTIPPDQVAVAWESLLSEEGRKILDAIEQRGKIMGIPVEKKIVEGIPDEEIIKEAKKQDLIVMGCRSSGFFERFITNNTCEQVLDKSSSSVMTFQMKK